MSAPQKGQTADELLDMADRVFQGEDVYMSQPPETKHTKPPGKKRKSSEKPKYLWGNLTHELASECGALSDEQFGKLIRMILDYEENGTVPEITDNMIDMGWNNAIGKYTRMVEIGNVKRYAVSCRKDR